MNLHRMLLQRAEAGRPVRIGLIGAGKFGAMFLAQARMTAGFHVIAVADLVPENARAALERTGSTPPTTLGWSQHLDVPQLMPA